MKSKNEDKKKINVSCPHCAEKFSYYQSEFRPFCSERCKMIDLGQWLDESYRVPAQEIPPEVNQDEYNDEDDY
jgi:uncharacterized protein